MLQPKSKLPWTCRTINTPEKFKGQIEVFNKENKFICTGSLSEDSNTNLEYIVQSCNNFPEAINLLKIAKEALEELGEFQDGWNEDLDKIEKFLEKIYKDGK